MKKLILIAFAFTSTLTFAQYNICAGKSVVKEFSTEQVYDEETEKYETITVESDVKNKDDFGNAAGNQYDLAIDGAFEGQTIVVLNLISVRFDLPKEALKEKGFSTYEFKGAAPTAEQLQEALSKACQLWVISSDKRMLNDEHADLIERFFYSGKGVYIWGDNDPLHADANFLAERLIGVTMNGRYMGDKNVSFKTDKSNYGMQADHLITTGLEYVYEGITISKINDPKQNMNPLIWSTDGNVVAAYYENQGQRLIIDGGFTRLYHKWDSAGTGRYVKNAASWLVNYERFGEDVVSETLNEEAP